MEVIGSVARTYEVVEKKQLLEKMPNFPVTKRIWPILLVFSSVTNLKGQCVKVQKVFQQLLRKLLGNVLGPKGR